MAAPRLQIRRGTAAPSGAIGLAGEPFVDTSNSNMYFSTSGTVGSQGSAFVHVGGATYTARTDEFLTASVASTSVGSVTIKDAQASQNSVTIDVPATVTTSYNFTLPADDGTSGFVLQTDGSGNTSWVSQTAGYTGWNISDGSTTEAITSGNTLTVTGSTGIDATVTATDTLTIAIDATVATSSSNLSFFAATTSAELAGVISDETGSGALVFASTPTLDSPSVDDVIFNGSTSGTTTVLATAVAGTTTLTLPAATDTLVGRATSDTFTNKTFDANATGNSLSNVEVADFAGAAIVTEAEGLASSDNDTSLPTTAAVIDYVDTSVGNVDLTITTAEGTNGTGGGGGSVSTSQTMTFAGTTNEIDVTVAGQSITYGLPDNVTVTGDLAVNGADITTTATGTATVFNTNATTLNIGGAATAVSIGNTGGTVTIPGNLTVSGTTTTVNSTTVTIADLNITLASGAADAAEADGAGLTIDGANATWTFEDNFVEGGTEDAWVTSEHLAIAADKNFYMDGGAIIVLDDTTGTTTGYVSMLNTIIDAGTY